MSDATQSQLDRLYRRALMTIAPTQITATDDAGPIHKAQVRVHGTPEVIDEVSVMQLYGVTSHAPVGTDATALFCSGQRSNAVIIATGNQQFRLRGLQLGEVALYTDEGDWIKLARGKVVEVHCGTRVHIDCPLVEITGELRVQGEITRGYGTGHQVTLGQHTHNQPADSNGDGEQPTNPPTSGT